MIFNSELIGLTAITALLLASAADAGLVMPKSEDFIDVARNPLVFAPYGITIDNIITETSLLNHYEGHTNDNRKLTLTCVPAGSEKDVVTAKVVETLEKLTLSNNCRPNHLVRGDAFPIGNKKCYVGMPQCIQTWNGFTQSVRFLPMQGFENALQFISSQFVMLGKAFHSSGIKFDFKKENICFDRQFRPVITRLDAATPVPSGQSSSVDVAAGNSVYNLLKSLLDAYSAQHPEVQSRFQGPNANSYIMGLLNANYGNTPGYDAF
ncbi:hypothetical protein BDF22DRAFT_685511 [Syncephalis plumigaleata]|nr:hypothetical protein BDF22DRAFT_685511 [Syncephalis plumigaleata]